MSEFTTISQGESAMKKLVQVTEQRADEGSDLLIASSMASEIMAERERIGLLLCPVCSGYGTVPAEIESSQGRMYLRSTCNRCNGSGLAAERQEGE